MDDHVIYLETGSVDPYYNLAFEEYVLTHRMQGNYLILWQNDNTIVVGCNQNTEAEINRPFVEAHHIRVVRRSTGGGAVYHDLGNLNYSFITDNTPNQKLAMQRFTQPVVSVLRDLGLHAEASGRNDILVEGRKVSGTAQRIYKNRILHHGTLLFCSNPSAVEGALRVDPAKFQSKNIQSIRSRIGNIRDYLQNDMTLPDFWSYLKNSLAGKGAIESTLSPKELQQVQQLKQDKYATWEWNYGQSMPYTVSNCHRFAAGTLDIRVNVEKGRITACNFFGDFLSICSLQPLKEALVGCRFCRDEITSILAEFDLQAMFGGISLQNIVDVMLAADDSERSEEI